MSRLNFNKLKKVNTSGSYTNNYNCVDRNSIETKG